MTTVCPISSFAVKFLSKSCSMSLASPGHLAESLEPRHEQYHQEDGCGRGSRGSRVVQRAHCVSCGRGRGLRGAAREHGDCARVSGGRHAPHLVGLGHVQHGAPAVLRQVGRQRGGRGAPRAPRAHPHHAHVPAARAALQAPAAVGWLRAQSGRRGATWVIVIFDCSYFVT